MTTFAHQLDTILRCRGHTSYWLAQQMRTRGTKTTPWLIELYRQGRTQPSLPNAQLIAEILGVSHTFLTGKE